MKKLSQIEGQIGMFDEDLPKKVSKSSARYWSAAYKLFKSYGEYVAKDKFWRNVSDPSLSHVVGLQRAFQKSFHGSFQAVERARAEKFNVYIANFNEFRTICVEYGVTPPDRRWLENIIDGRDIDSYQTRCMTRLKRPEKYPATALTDMPRPRTK